MRSSERNSIENEDLSWNERRFEGLGVEKHFTRNEKKFLGIGDKQRLTRNEKKFMGIGEKEKLSKNEKKFLGIQETQIDSEKELVDSDKALSKDIVDKNDVDLVKEKDTQYESESTNLNPTDNLGNWEKVRPEITPKENLDAANPNYEKGEEWQVNCQRCVPTYEMRSRGYDVTAQPCEDYNDYLSYNPLDVWEKPDVHTTTGNGMSDIEKQMSEWGDGSRAQVIVLWERGDGGHTFTAEQRDGKTVFVDPQSGDTGVEWYFDEAKKDSTKFCRIDNVQPSNYILDCCEKRSEEK